MTSAIYFDGLSARLHEVELEASAAGIVIAGADVARVYAPAEARLAERFDNAPAVLHFSDGARCETSPAVHAELARALGYRETLAVRWQARWQGALAALVLLAAIIAATAFWGVPAAGEMIAARLPASADAAMGKTMLTGLLRQGVVSPTRFSDERIEEILRIMDTVRPAHPRVPIRLRLYQSNQLGPNALALPDGTIILTDEMVRIILDKRRVFDDYTTAQLAGVLAHEVGHIEQRHGARVIARTSLGTALSASLFGDFSALAAGVPAVLSTMSYKREMETEADEYAMKALRSHGMPLEPLADLFVTLESTPEAEAARFLPRWLSKSVAYAASHPPTSQRIERLRRPQQAAR